MKSRWYITHSAVNSYVNARKWPDDDAHFEKAEDALLQMCGEAEFRSRDTEGRELWKSPRRTGSGLRWVVDRRQPQLTRGAIKDPRPRVIWVGYGRPPEHLWTPAGDDYDGAVASLLDEILGTAESSEGDFDLDSIRSLAARVRELRGKRTQK
jgi:hypothetical protein